MLEACTLLKARGLDADVCHMPERVFPSAGTNHIEIGRSKHQTWQAETISTIG